MGKEKFSWKKLALVGVVFILAVALILTFMKGYGSVNEDDIKVQLENGSLIETDMSDFSSNLPFLSSNNVQGFVFVDEESTNYKNYKLLSATGDIYHHKPQDKVYVGSTCNVGNAIRIWYCDKTSNGYSCTKDMFANMFYISKAGDYLYLNGFYNHNDDFYFTYGCYDYKESTTPTYEERNVWVKSSNTCLTPKEATGMSDVFAYGSEKECLAKVSSTSGSTSGGTSDLSGATGKYGTFTSIKYESEVEQYGKTSVQGSFKVSGNYDKLLFEVVLNRRTYQPFSTVSIGSDSSACDGSKYYASDYAYNLKDGDTVKFDFDLLTPDTVGTYDLQVYAVKGCSYDVGDDSNIVMETKKVNVTAKEIDYNSGDVDGDGVKDDYPDNCRFNKNPEQYDIDGDGIGDVCDICSLQKGVVAQKGCHPCQDLPLSDSCWSEFDSQTSTSGDGTYDDPRYTEEEGSKNLVFEDYFSDYLKKLQEQAEKQEEVKKALEEDTTNIGDAGEMIKPEEVGTYTCEQAFQTNSVEIVKASCSDAEIEQHYAEQGGKKYETTDEDDAIIIDGEVIPRTCEANDYKIRLCPTGETIVSEVCYEGAFVNINDCLGNTAIPETGFMSKFGTYVYSGIGLIVLAGGALLLL